MAGPVEETRSAVRQLSQSLLIWPYYAVSGSSTCIMMKAGQRDRSSSRIISDRHANGVADCLSISRGGEQDGQQHDELWITTREMSSRDSPPKYGPLSPTSQNTLVRKGRANSSAKMKKADLLRSFELQLAIM